MICYILQATATVVASDSALIHVILFMHQCFTTAEMIYGPSSFAFNTHLHLNLQDNMPTAQSCTFYYCICKTI